MSSNFQTGLAMTTEFQQSLNETETVVACNKTVKPTGIGKTVLTFMLGPNGNRR